MISSRAGKNLKFVIQNSCGQLRTQDGRFATEKDLVLP
jgi:hypothetical protein